jgi:phosphoribosylformylglycinamidine (FGAM) synthase-like enzyme
MTVTATTVRTPLRERLISLLDAMVYGLHPEDECKACADAIADRCEECEQAFADVDALNTAITAVQDAATGIAAIAAYDSCLLSLAGITSGGDAGTEDEMTIPGVGN